MALRRHPDDTKCQGDFYEVMRPMAVAAVATFARGIDSSTKEDLVQDSLLKLMGKIKKFKPKRGKLHSWSTQIIRHLCIDYFRRQKPLTNQEGIGHDATTIDKTSSIDADTFSELRAFFPFYISNRTFCALYEVLENHQFLMSHLTVKRAKDILRANKIDYSKAGSLADILQFMIAMIRGWLLSHDEARQVDLALKIQESPKLNAVRALSHYIGPKKAAVVVHVLGGLSIKIPTAADVLAPTDVPVTR